NRAFRIHTNNMLSVFLPNCYGVNTVIGTDDTCHIAWICNVSFANHRGLHRLWQGCESNFVRSSYRNQSNGGSQGQNENSGFLHNLFLTYQVRWSERKTSQGLP